LDRRPIGLHYQDSRPEGAVGFKSDTGCFVGLLKSVEQGKQVVVSGEHGCFGGRFYCGFSGEPFEGQAEYVSLGEHYIKTPELCRQIWNDYPPPPAAGEWLVFQRLDTYGASADPEVVVFLASPDSIAGLHFLASYDRGIGAVIAPFASGCGAIVAFPRLEAQEKTHRAVLGLFDPSARCTEDPGVLSFAADVARIKEMLANISECFLQHDAWRKIRARHQ
jgi:hypothetical protein